MRAGRPACMPVQAKMAVRMQFADKDGYIQSAQDPEFYHNALLWLPAFVSLLPVKRIRPPPQPGAQPQPACRTHALRALRSRHRPGHAAIAAVSGLLAQPCQYRNSQHPGPGNGQVCLGAHSAPPGLPGMQGASRPLQPAGLTWRLAYGCMQYKDSRSIALRHDLTAMAHSQTLAAEQGRQP